MSLYSYIMDIMICPYRAYSYIMDIMICPYIADVSLCDKDMNSGYAIVFLPNIFSLKHYEKVNGNNICLAMCPIN